ncbi:MAG: tetratricopeptide repeat protein [Archaeoglobaceae archaeon]|nr:tetratricopeptide repeat protein [Archaeoglobaceae archaeon]
MHFFAFAYFNRAIAYRQIGEYKKTVNDLSKAIEFDQNLGYNRMIPWKII